MSGVTPSNQQGVHSTHCCPVHGCKYGDARCPIITGFVEPAYPNNNGCEECMGDEAEVHAATMSGKTRLDIDTERGVAIEPVTRPDPGTWVQVWGQVIEDPRQVLSVPEEVTVRFQSKTDEYTAYVRTEHVVVPEQPPAFAPKCTALYDAKGGMLWRCYRTRDHSGSHIANGGSLSWPQEVVYGYFEEA